MKELLLKTSYIRLAVAVGLVIIGAYLYVSSGDKQVARFLLAAGFVGHLYFGLTYFLMKKKK